MTDVLHLPADPTAPVACDMSFAPDTPQERLRSYGSLFERALLRHERRDDRVVFAFRAGPGVRETVDELARREAACCPFLAYRVETIGDEVVWTASGDERGSVQAILDAFHALPADDAAGSLLPGRP